VTLHPPTARRRRDRDEVVSGAFDVGVILKGIDGILEIVGGLFLLLVPLRDIRRFLIWVTGRELSKDPKDFIATRLVHLANTLSVSGYRLTIAYLLIHGIVKVFLVYMLLRRRLWAYPTAIAVFAAFGVYQVYQFTISHSALLIALTVLDAAVIFLTVWEYRILTRRERTAGSRHDGGTAASAR
jgi:uncharacterized membrane protein